MCWCERTSAAWLEHILRFCKFTWKSVFEPEKNVLFFGWRTRSEAYAAVTHKIGQSKLVAECFIKQKHYFATLWQFWQHRSRAQHKTKEISQTRFCVLLPSLKLAMRSVWNCREWMRPRIEFIEKCNVWITRNQKANGRSRQRQIYIVYLNYIFGSSVCQKWHFTHIGRDGRLSVANRIDASGPCAFQSKCDCFDNFAYLFIPSLGTHSTRSQRQSHAN